MAENIRYGQGISEGGFGGLTSADGSFGKADAGAQSKTQAVGRAAQGYGGDSETDGQIGA